MTQDELNGKHSALFDSEEWEDDPDAIQREWQKFLEDSGCITGHHVDCNWGDYGVLPFIDNLIEYINEGQQVIVLEDPDAENSDHMGYLVFPR